MYSRINYTVVGLFVLLFSTALLAFGFWLAKYGFEQKYDYYYLYFSEPVDGLTLDSTVKLKGVDVGKVSEITVLPEDVEHIRVMIRLREGTPIVEGMYAVLKLQGITGLSYVEIEGGSRGGKPIPTSEAKIGTIPTRPSLSHRLVSKAPALVEKLERAVDGLEKLLGESNRKYVGEILANSATVTRNAIRLEERIIALTGEVNATLRRFDRGVDTLTTETRRITRVLDRELPPVLHNVKEAGYNIAEVAKGIDKRLKRGEYDLRRLIRPLQVDISELSYRYQELAEELKNLGRNPSSILFGGGRPPKGPGE
jgi:phospholipid/cholesterol/gamma-HCH transport system substrate-binding protein